MRKLIVVAAVALLVPAAAAARPPVPVPPVPTPQPVTGTWAPGVEISYTETIRDAAGQIVSQTHQDGIKPGTLFGSAGGGASIAASGLANATAVDSGSNLAAARQPVTRRLTACCSAGGSDTVDYTVTQRTSIFQLVAWRYHQVDHWCWSYPRITCLDVGAGFYNVDGLSSVVNSADNGYGWYYNWAGSPTGGHYAHRNGSVSNCLFRFGCVSTAYPYVDMWLNANGAWTASGGGTN